ncbi:glutamine-hydrolyzing carbamoyl-phosphate synthase small subunit [Candidatus Woesearchaeota archaeon]|nr:glutamine-hydrolyzing carbamoyl-phosphate synthase small subunit [Candidatus Woesearchaeota archaeon]
MRGIRTKAAAKLILKDGSVFCGYSFGASKSTSGEVVFNTGMTGYPEAMTDPSYRGQILCLTYPLIGNYGVPAKEYSCGLEKSFESGSIHIRALIVSSYSELNSHWSSKKSLGEWMEEFCIPGIYGIDTRALTKKLREHGTMLGKVIVDNNAIDDGTEAAGYHNRKFEEISKSDLVSEVTVSSPTVYKPEENKKGSKAVILVDCGCKNNIIRSLLKRNITVIRVPYDYDFNSSGYEFDGIFISNGPGDPKMCRDTIRNVRTAMEQETPKPIFGICLGNQIVALASGADTYKLKYGHRSQNQPCIEKSTSRCYITSQNHGYAVDAKTLQPGWKEWFVNANDNTNEGILHKTKPFMSVQFHPEATAGPVDTSYLFDRFVEML